MWAEVIAMGPKGPCRIERSEFSEMMLSNYKYWREKDSRTARLQRGYRFTPLFGWYHPKRTLKEQSEIDCPTKKESPLPVLEARSLRIRKAGQRQSSPCQTSSC